ncbi:MAG: bile acid:sodium symporter family protein [Alphaproteobacteria bacterium]|nr:bile acid:sodium symporter family protein [Alphaproteobacteria bacterium]
MSGNLQRLADVTILVFVVSTMLSMGMSQAFADVVAPLRKPSRVARALAVNFIAAPLLAVILVRIVPLAPAHASGMLLIGTAAGAPFLPKLAAMSRLNAACAVALMVLLMGGSLVFMPLAVPWLVPGLSADPAAIARPLLMFMVIPLAVGFALALAGKSWTKPVLGFTRIVSSAAFVLLIVLMTGLNFATIASAVGSFAIGTYALYLVALAAIGYLAAATDRDTQKVFALAAAGRNIPAALVVAGASREDGGIAASLVIAFVVSLVVLLPLARALRPREQPARTDERLAM